MRTSSAKPNFLPFLSTPSARRATVRCGLLPPTRYDFYPRPPRGGRPGQRHCADHLQNFYPRPPRGGRPASVLPWVHASRFLSTPSARRATCPLEPACADTCISIHALREEGDRNRCFRADRSADFYPRPPRGGRPRAAIGGDKQKEISIHALREEGDVTDLGQIKLPYRISIHDMEALFGQDRKSVV